MTMPEQKPGKSRQDYGTPKEFLAAVKNRLRITNFSWDLAADFNNTVVEDTWDGTPRYYNEKQDSLAQDWHKHEGWLWLNPPFTDIRPWARKATEEAQLGANIAMLVPASVGANWWKDWVNYYAYTVFLNGRLTFVGETTPYPKDCALLLYVPWRCTGTEIWTWSRVNVDQL